MQQAEDFREESRALAAILADSGDDVWTRPTLFKQWTVDDILAHLHWGNVAALWSLAEKERFAPYAEDLMQRLATGMSLRAYAHEWLGGISGRELYMLWQKDVDRVADAFAAADPKERLKWFGPDMSARSSITARHMETWAHGQAIYDLLRIERVDTDRIRNIAHMGVTTFGWTFVNRGLPVPPAAPHVRLTAPSGAIWEWNEDNADDLVEGAATAFCQVVTQTRNVRDTGLRVEGGIATRWMAMAQCFAGPPEDPPAPGARL